MGYSKLSDIYSSNSSKSTIHNRKLCNHLAKGANQYSSCMTLTQNSRVRLYTDQIICAIRNPTYFNTKAGSVQGLKTSAPLTNSQIKKCLNGEDEYVD